MARKKKPPPPRAAGPPARRPNKESRSREHLTEDEVERIRKAAARLGRNGHRDATMVLMAYRHGLRVAELVGLKWDAVDLDARAISIARVKGSKSGGHPLAPDEVKALKLLRPNARDRRGPVFPTERGGSISESGFFKVLARAGEEAGLAFPVHPHMLRHACGYEMTRAGFQTRVIQDWLGHRNIQHTVRYTELDPERFGKGSPWDRRPRRPAAAGDDQGDDD